MIFYRLIVKEGIIKGTSHPVNENFHILCLPWGGRSRRMPAVMINHKKNKEIKMAQQGVSSCMFADSTSPRDRSMVIRKFQFTLDPHTYLVPGSQQFTDQAQKQVQATFRKLFDDYPVHVEFQLVPGTATKRANLLLEVTGPLFSFEKVDQAIAEIDARNIHQSIERARRVAIFLEGEYAADGETPISSNASTVFAAQPGMALLTNHPVLGLSN